MILKIPQEFVDCWKSVAQALWRSVHDSCIFYVQRIDVKQLHIPWSCGALRKKEKVCDFGGFFKL